MTMRIDGEAAATLVGAGAPGGVARNMVSIASGKGGVGKTWFAITLSHALARQGQRVLLFDGDIGLANVDIQLGLIPDRDLAAVIDGAITLKGAARPFAAGGFDIVAGRSGSGSLAALSPQRLADLRAELLALADGYDRVIVDLGAGIERSTRQMTLQSKTVIVITTEEPTALTDAYAFIKVTHTAKPDADIRVVVNMARSLREGERTYDTLARACQNFLGVTPPLAGIIREDRHIRDAIRAQLPLLVRSPTAHAAADVETIAARLVKGP